jgi:DNA-directed RNA polymerase subunit RPC12/RpoP
MQIKYTPEEWKRILNKYVKTNVRCPLCGTPIYVKIKPYVYVEHKEGNTIEITIEQVCENNECTYNPIKSYEIQIEP